MALLLSSFLERVEGSYKEVDDDSKIEGDASPKSHVTAEPEQQWVGWKTWKSTVLDFYLLACFTTKDTKEIISHINQSYLLDQLIYSQWISLCSWCGLTADCAKRGINMLT